MPLIDIPDTLDFSAADAYAAIADEIDRQQQLLRRTITDTLREAANRMADANALPDADVAEALRALDAELTEQRQAFVRLGRVEATMRTRAGA